MDEAMKKIIAMSLAMLFAFISLILALILFFQKPYRTTLEGTYRSVEGYGSDDPMLGYSLIFRRDGYYAKFTSTTLYETGTFELMNPEGRFRLTADGSGTVRHVWAMKDGQLCFPEGDDLEFYTQVSDFPATVCGPDATWEYNEEGKLVNIS
jgi:hypothetical protein